MDKNYRKNKQKKILKNLTKKQKNIYIKIKTLLTTKQRNRNLKKYIFSIIFIFNYVKKINNNFLYKRAFI